MTRRVINSNSDDEMELMNNFPDEAGGGIGAGAAPPPAVLEEISEAFRRFKIKGITEAEFRATVIDLWRRFPTLSIVQLVACLFAPESMLIPSAELNSEGIRLVTYDNMAMANRNVEEFQQVRSEFRSEFGVMERVLLNQHQLSQQHTEIMNEVRLNQQQLSDNHQQLSNYIQTQDRANSKMFNAIEKRMQEEEQRNELFRRDTKIHIQDLQSSRTELGRTQREQGSQINNNGTRINEVDARVDQLQEELSAIKTYLERFSFAE